MITKSKIKGMLLGGAIGDAWGMPTEVMTPIQIKKEFPNGVYKYFDPPESHKWFTPETMPAGSITDDTILTIATMKGLMEVGGFNMDIIARAQVTAWEANPQKGFGRSTKEALKKIAQGISWKESADDDPKSGYGNGVCMKCAPLAAWYDTPHGETCDYFNRKLIDYASMTHKTQMGVLSGIIHTHSLCSLLWEDPDTFDKVDWLEHLCWSVFEWQSDEDSDCHYDISHLPSSEDNLEYRFNELRENRGAIEEYWNINDLLKRYGDGSCYVYNSLPFTYAVFYQNPHSMDTGKLLVEAGGDTDTNAKMALEMIGALHGIEFFERDENRWALDTLLCRDELLELAEEFCNQFRIK